MSKMQFYKNFNKKLYTNKKCFDKIAIETYMKLIKKERV